MKHTKNKKRIKDIQQTKDYKGEASPYWEHLENNNFNNQNKGGTIEYFEPIEGNPDLLGEDKGLYYIKSDLNSELLEKIKMALPFLTEKQQLVLQMVGYEGKTLENVGAILKMSKGNVSDLLKRASKTIREKIRTFK